MNWQLLLASLALVGQVHHYVFFNRDRERISEPTFLETNAFEGAQLKYSWRQLEPEKDKYNFGEIQHDLAFLKSKGKKLFIQIQDISYDRAIVLVPRYLLIEPQYHGGADKQYTDKGAEEGWVARRWDPTVRERFQKLLLALGKEFDGKIEGINLPETAVDFGEGGRLFPKGFTPEVYVNAVVETMAVLKRAFPKSVAMQYANFMTGEGRLTEVYRRAKDLNVGLGGPDLLPYKRWQMRNSYPLLREYAGSVPTGIAVQDGNYGYIHPNTGKQVTISELIAFGTKYLKVEYIFWCTEEPFYSRQLIPYLRAHTK